ncbi:MAG: sulfatase-like hydrolase/transferase [Candidatus Pacebacteria bacterium]|nr:sulfatase-like hydrolase/transferase [Candidatus Paceibacterota bacterium]
MPKTKPNILLLMSDQHSPRFLGCYGDETLPTPALDSLAANGVAFDSAYCPAPLCVPSRMAFLSGRHCHQIGVWNNSHILRSDIPTFAHGLGIAGYKTVLVGRMHFLGEDQHHGFQERRLGDISPSFPARNAAIERYRDYWGSLESIQSAGPGRSHDLEFDQAVAMEACRVIYDHEVSGDPRPLCLVASFFGPHDPWKVPKRLFDRFAGLSDRLDSGETTLPPFAEEVRRAAGFDTITAEQTCRMRDAYRAKCAFVDETIQHVLTAFAESPLSDNAAIVYTSDHGEMAGEKGLWTKSVFYEAATRVPMIVSWPGTLPRGKHISANVSLLDLTATLLDMGCAPEIPDMAGTSLIPLASGHGEQGNGAVFAELGKRTIGGPCRMVRHNQWKAVFYRSLQPELYNIGEDPEEMTNLAGTSPHDRVLSDLEALARDDGWDPNRVARRLEQTTADIEYLSQWVRATNPSDTIQWGLPAPL